MSAKSEKAVETFMCGYNCAQSVFLSFCEDFGIDRDTAAKMVTSQDQEHLWNSFRNGTGHWR